MWSAALIVASASLRFWISFCIELEDFRININCGCGKIYKIGFGWRFMKEIVCAGFGCLKILENLLIEKIEQLPEGIKKRTNIRLLKNYVLRGISDSIILYNKFIFKKDSYRRDVFADSIERHVGYMISYLEKEMFGFEWDIP